MAKGPENKWRDFKLRPFLNKLPCSYHFVKEAKSVRGIPDLVGSCNGRFFALECKASKRAKLQPLQAYTVELINSSRGFAAIIYPENAHEVLVELLASCYGAASVPALLPLLCEYFPNRQLQKVSLRKKR